MQMMKAGTPEKVDQEPIGTGPFQFVDYQKDAVIRYKAFPDYWGGKAKIDDLVFAITPDPTARLAKLQGQRVPGDGATRTRPTSPTIKANDELNLLEQAGLNIGYLALTSTKPPFDKKEVRHAINMAIDKADDPEGGLSGCRPAGRRT